MSFGEYLAGYLRNLDITFEPLEHEPFFTVEETLGVYESMGIPENKSLFLRDEKKKRFFLVVMGGEKRADLKALAAHFDENRLSFCSESALLEKLHTTPGAVSPFGLINESANAIQVLIDQDLLHGDHIGFHPNLNTQTWKMSVTDFEKFLDYLPQTISRSKL